MRREFSFKRFLKLGIAVCSVFFLTACSAGNSESDQTFSTSELSNFDGRNGNRCLVAVNNRVYEISNSSFWLNGIHTESEGKASCGRDLSDVIRESPHGVSILTTSPKVQQVGRLT